MTLNVLLLRRGVIKQHNTQTMAWSISVTFRGYCVPSCKEKQCKVCRRSTEGKLAKMKSFMLQFCPKLNAMRLSSGNVQFDWGEVLEIMYLVMVLIAIRYYIAAFVLGIQAKNCAWSFVWKVFSIWQQCSQPWMDSALYSNLKKTVLFSAY